MSTDMKFAMGWAFVALLVVAENLI